MVLIYEFALGEDPAELSKVLWAQSIGHRVIPSDRGMQIWLNDPSMIELAQEMIAHWQQSPTTPFTPTKAARTNNLGLKQQLLRSPITVIVLLASAIVGLLTSLGDNLQNVSNFTITPFWVSGSNLHFLPFDQMLQTGEWWRVLSPAFLHFGIAHIVFNSLWIWDLGRRIEQAFGLVAYLIGFLVVAIGSNLAQFLISGYPVFGGLSGVVYGLVGFAWCLPHLWKGMPAVISKPMMIFFLVWLGLGFTDFLAMLGLGSMANTAHLSGLVGGIVCALILKLVKRRHPLTPRSGE